MIEKQIGLRLAVIRTQQGLSQSDLARRIGRTQDQICRIEQGRSVTLSNIVVVAQGLGLSFSVDFLDSTLDPDSPINSNPSP